LLLRWKRQEQKLQARMRPVPTQQVRTLREQACWRPVPLQRVLPVQKLPLPVARRALQSSVHSCRRMRRARLP
jgi:hypothetical protein